MWEIENVDEAGEGLFYCDAPDAESAMKIYRQHETAWVNSMQQVEWASLASVSGELGETYYFKTRGKKP